MDKYLTIHDDSRFPIDARELHKKLGVEIPYHEWFLRICEHGFSNGVDFEVSLKKELTSQGSCTTINYRLSIPMAKAICTLRRTEEAREIRLFLIAFENAYKTSERLMEKALKIADNTITSLSQGLRDTPTSRDYNSLRTRKNYLGRTL